MKIEGNFELAEGIQYIGCYARSYYGRRYLQSNIHYLHCTVNRLPIGIDVASFDFNDIIPWKYGMSRCKFPKGRWEIDRGDYGGTMENGVCVDVEIEAPESLIEGRRSEKKNR